MKPKLHKAIHPKNPKTKCGISGWNCNSGLWMTDNDKYVTCKRCLKIIHGD